MIKDRINKLRKLMQDREIFAYIIPSSDYHQSEYVGDYFKSREYISGFEGSAGTVVVTMEEAGLWTDGRYFIQAEQELQGSDIKLFKMGVEDVPTIEEYLIEKMPKNSILGFDGKVMSAKEGKDLEDKLSFKNISIKFDKDLVDMIWEERTSLPQNKAFLLGTEYSGVSFSEKLKRVREELKKQKATMNILTTLDDVAWLFNIRGRDIQCNPVVLAYAVVGLKEVNLFIDESKLTDEIKIELDKENVIIRAYDELYEFVKTIDEEEIVLIDPNKINYAVYGNLASIRKIEKDNPTLLFKAIKNEIELKNIRNSHINDGVAFTKFMYWLKNNISKEDINELTASNKLQSLREQQDKFIEPSFTSISAYKEHAAIMHYRPTEENSYKLEAKGLYLIDSGGQYLDGTTDITRTMALGEITKQEETDFTNVLRGMIRLSKAKFLHGCRGYNLDILARGPMWDNAINYRSGTGHGIGFVLNVHEAPNGFRWNVVPERNDSCVLEEGMVTTNEPGIYIEGSHGIRIENEIVVRKAEKNEYGQFMNFEVITFAPIDLDAINPELMLRDEIDYLNQYHEQVYNKISPFLTKEEQEWLKQYTRKI